MNKAEQLELYKKLTGKDHPNPSEIIEFEYDGTARARAVANSSNDWRIRALERERDQLNKIDPKSIKDPWEIDHIRPICQGGEHEIENLRLLRRSKNCEGELRSEERIKLLLAINRKLLGLPDGK